MTQKQTMKKDNIIIIGAAGRNVGKTEFACELISKYAFPSEATGWGESPDGQTNVGNEVVIRHMSNNTSANVIGVKITTIKEKDGKCPRGGEGCGVCTSLKGDYMITEETEGAKSPREKDTVRMLDAGATKVYWLRVLSECLEEGVSELLKLIPKDACIVCESNSARRVIEPGVFIIIKEKGTNEFKHSCKSVAEFADEIIDFDGTGWSIQPDDIEFANNRWKIN